MMHVVVLMDSNVLQCLIFSFLVHVIVLMPCYSSDACLCVVAGFSSDACFCVVAGCFSDACCCSDV